ncbi:MAG: hypothetical protein WAU31_03805 [Candidatus Moraniibacteriota bacterium]
MKKESTILVISNKWDAHADAVIHAIEKNDRHVVRLNTEDFRQNEVSFTSRDWCSDWYIRTPEGRIISRETIGGVYIRRMAMPIDVSDVNERFQDFTRKESAVFLDAISTLLEDALWLNRPYCREQASNKMRQLLLAQRVGLATPHMLITNVESDGKDFCASEGDVVYKTLNCPMLRFEDGSQSMINTSIVPGGMDFSTVRTAPAFFQGYVSKAYELRIHIIGGEIIPIKIDSQHYPDARIDWRIAQGDIHYERTLLPEDISRKLLELMYVLKIRFGIIDMIVTEGGEYVFLEVNPDGNWLWIEQKIHVPISESIALYFLK